MKITMILSLLVNAILGIALSFYVVKTQRLADSEIPISMDKSLVQTEVADLKKWAYLANKHKEPNAFKASFISEIKKRLVSAKAEIDNNPKLFEGAMKEAINKDIVDTERQIQILGEP